MLTSRYFGLCLAIIQIARVTTSVAYSNELHYFELTKELMHRLDKPMAKGWDLDAWRALHSLNTTLSQYIAYQQSLGLADSREEVINSRIGLFLFTRFCGPGGKLLNKIFQTDERTYSQIDVCCRFHDECPDYVNSFGDYSNYPGLDFRRQFFSR